MTDQPSGNDRSDNPRYDDSLTITFKIDNRRYEGTLWHVGINQPFDPALEDLGVGFKLEQPDLIAVDVAWLDDYDDKHEPVLAASALYYALEPADPASLRAEPQDTWNVLQESIHIPGTISGGGRIAEWIVTYMTDNVYNHRTDGNTL